MPSIAPASRANRSAVPCLGASGVGKTSVVDHYRKLHPPAETETATRQPVLKVTLQPDARPKGIAADMLLALGRSRPGRAAPCRP